MSAFFRWLLVGCLLSSGALAETTSLSPTFNGGTVANPLNAPSYQIGGVTVLGVTAGTGGFQSVVVGPGAGLALTTDNFFATVVGNQAAPSYAVSGNGELTAIGGRACWSLVSGNFDTCLGVGALNQATSVNDVTSLGADSFRNSQGINDATAAGWAAGYNFMGQRTNLVGAIALYGNAASLLIGGTKTTGDVISVTLTAAAISGGAVTVPYTVLAGDTITTIAAGVASAILNTAAVTSAGISVNTNVNVSPLVIGIGYHGNATIAPTLVVTASVSGSASETVTITGGIAATASDMNFMGYQAGYGLRMTSANKVNGIGSFVLANIVNQSTTNCFGYAACEFEQNGSSMDVMGSTAFQNATSAFLIASLGANNGNSCTSCDEVTLIGPNIFPTALTNQHNILALSDGAGCDAAVSSGAFRVCMGGVTILSGIGTGTASTSSFSFPGPVAIAGALSLNGTTIGIPYQTYSCAVPLTTGVGASTLTCFMKAVRAFTVDNITATVAGTLVTVTPSVFECGTSTTCASPTTIGSGAVTSSNTATPITVSSAAVAAGDYIAVELTAGTVTSVAVNIQVEMH